MPPIQGKPAPAFTLDSTNGKGVSLKDFQGKKIVLYFYPKDDTSGCTKEACDFRDALPTYGKDVVVLGVSPDSIASHDKFKSKYSLPFLLLSDPDHSVSEKYGVWKEKSMYGRKYMGIERTTFVIDSAGKMAKIFNKVKVPDHHAEVAAALADIK